jgi:hypothetical protein
MPRVLVRGFPVSLDGFGAGPEQSIDVVLGRGEALLAGIDLPALGYAVTEHVSSGHAMHVVLTKG